MGLNVNRIFYGRSFSSTSLTRHPASGICTYFGLVKIRQGSELDGPAPRIRFEDRRYVLFPRLSTDRSGYSRILGNLRGRGPTPAPNPNTCPDQLEWHLPQLCHMIRRQPNNRDSQQSAIVPNKLLRILVAAPGRPCSKAMPTE
jgi:hypothetical protein